MSRFAPRNHRRGRSARFIAVLLGLTAAPCIAHAAMIDFLSSNTSASYGGTYGVTVGTVTTPTQGTVFTTTAGASPTTDFYGSVGINIGAAVPTQTLQVGGSATFSNSVGIGVTNPDSGAAFEVGTTSPGANNATTSTALFEVNSGTGFVHIGSQAMSGTAALTVFSTPTTGGSNAGGSAQAVFAAPNSKTGSQYWTFDIFSNSISWLSSYGGAAAAIGTGDDENLMLATDGFWVAQFNSYGSSTCPSCVTIGGVNSVGAINNPSHSLDIFPTAGPHGSSDGAVRAYAFYHNSDMRLKSDIHPIENALDKLLQIHGVEFNWKYDGHSDVGVIAQDVAKAFPEAVSADKGTRIVT